MTEYVSRHVPFDCAGMLDTSDRDDRESIREYDSLPVAALDFRDRIEEERLYWELAALGEAGALVARSGVWVPLAGDGPDAYTSLHLGHPLVQFLLRPTHHPDSAVVEELSFIVCVQCEALFIQHATRSEKLVVAPGVFEGEPEPSWADGLEVLVAELDPDGLAWAELQAWRYAYTICEHPGRE